MEPRRKIFWGRWNGVVGSGHDNFVESGDGDVWCGVGVVVGVRIGIGIGGWKYGGDVGGDLVLVGFADIRVGDKLVPIGTRRWRIATLGGVMCGWTNIVFERDCRVIGFGTKGNATTVVDFPTTRAASEKIVDLGGTLKAIGDPRVVRTVGVEVGGGGTKMVVMQKFTEKSIGGVLAAMRITERSKDAGVDRK